MTIFGRIFLYQRCNVLGMLSAIQFSNCVLTQSSDPSFDYAQLPKFNYTHTDPVKRDLINKYRIILSNHNLQDRYVYTYTQVVEWSRKDITRLVKDTKS